MNIEQILINFTNFGNSVFFFNIFRLEKFYFPFLIFFFIIISFYILIKTNFFSILMIKKSFQLLYQNKSSREDLSSVNILLMTLGSSIDLGTIFALISLISIYGSGLIFWVIIGGVLSMPIKYMEAYFAHKIKFKINHGPQAYIKYAFNVIKKKQLGKILAVIFSFNFVIATFFSLQINQTVTIFHSTFFKNIENSKIIITFIISIIIMIIALRGFKFIAKFNSIIMPYAISIYIIISVMIFIKFYYNIIPVFTLIIQNAFSFQAMNGYIFYHVFTGIQRAVFCSEAGFGSAAIDHANSKSKSSINEGLIATLNPIIAVIIVSCCSGLVGLVSEVNLNPNTDPVLLMTQIFGTVIGNSVAKYFILLLVPIFAITTAISWAYYGAFNFKYIFKSKYLPIYYVLLFSGYIFSGLSNNFLLLVNAADICALTTMIPNLIAIVILVKIFSKKMKQEISFTLKDQKYIHNQKRK